MSAPAKQSVPDSDPTPLTASGREEAYDELRKKVAQLQSQREDRARQRKHVLRVVATVSVATLASSLLLLLGWYLLS